MLGMGALVAGVRADAPVVAWASYPVGAGDHVILHGGSWGNHVRVVTDGGNTSPATVLSDTGLVFPFPGAAEKIVEGRVVNDDGESAPFAVNVPHGLVAAGRRGRFVFPGRRAARLRTLARALRQGDAGQAARDAG